MARWKHIHGQFSEEEFDQLKTVKGDRDWETAILEEFGVEGGDDE